jgi:hypothetical protein
VSLETVVMLEAPTVPPGFDRPNVPHPALTPEEDAIDDGEEDDEIDDTLPADLWF